MVDREGSASFLLLMSKKFRTGESEGADVVSSSLSRKLAAQLEDGDLGSRARGDAERSGDEVFRETLLFGFSRILRVVFGDGMDR